MSDWGPEAIARFARGAGFPDDLLHDVVSLAMAASGGSDHYRHNPITAPGAERRGLWAIRVDQVPEDLEADLFSPSDNAAVTRALFDQSGGQFAWHPAWINGHAARQKLWVQQALTPGGRRQGVRHLQGFGDALSRTVARANAYDRALSTGQVLHD